MSYPCTDCILDHIAASGPQESIDLKRECREQAAYTPALFTAALHKLLDDGRIVEEDGDDGVSYYDFPDSYYTGTAS